MSKVWLVYTWNKQDEIMDLLLHGVFSTEQKALEHISKLREYLKSDPYKAISMEIWEIDKAKEMSHV